MAQISIISRDEFPNWLRTDTSWFNLYGKFRFYLQKSFGDKLLLRTVHVVGFCKLHEIIPHYYAI